MKKRIKTTLFILIGIIAIYFIFAGYHIFSSRTTLLVKPEEIQARNPVFVKEDQKAVYIKKEMDVFPKEQKNITSFMYDFRGYDLSGLNLENVSEQLFLSAFDTLTIWPASLPKEFDPNQIMELGKHPGLGIEALHQEGITGKGVNLAIIDENLFLQHQEYRDNIMLYEIVDGQGIDYASMHGSAVTSIAVGKETGVAPEAKVYYIATTYGDPSFLGYRYNLTHIAKALERIIEINALLGENEKIRVVSISIGLDSSMKGYDKICSAIEHAKENGIFVITCSPEVYDSFILRGLGRNLYADPDILSSYTTGLIWQNDFVRNHAFYMAEKMLAVPMDARTYASELGSDVYTYNRIGGFSLTSPWLAGMYALCCQVKPDITPEEFIALAFQTGDTIPIIEEDTTFPLRTVINPQELISKIRYSERKRK